MNHHVGRSWAGHPLEDACPCPKEACGLVSQPSNECTEHPLHAMKTIRQSHRSQDCPGLAGQVQRLVSHAAEGFYSSLDDIAGKFELDSKQFRAFVEAELGELPGYQEWMQECWERIEGDVS